MHSCPCPLGTWWVLLFGACKATGVLALWFGTVCHHKATDQDPAVFQAQGWHPGWDAGTAFSLVAAKHGLAVVHGDSIGQVAVSALGSGRACLMGVGVCGGVWHKASVLGHLPLAVPIGLSPLLMLGGGGGQWEYH